MRSRFPLVIPLLVTSLLAGAAAPQAVTYATLDAVAHSYVLLVLRIDLHELGFNDYYYGPPELRAQVQREGKRPLAELRAQAQELLSALPEARGNAIRRAWFAKQLTALETKIRMLQGEKFSVTEQARLLFDLDVKPPTQEELEAALAALERALPGPGRLADQLDAWHKAFALPQNKVETAYQLALAEARMRARKLLLLPESEKVELAFVTGKSWGGYNWYQGNAHSRIEINLDLPASASTVYRYVAHEAYPGHHTDLATREQRLYREKGYLEWCVSPLYTPQNTMAEAVAEVGVDLLMPPTEFFAWHRDALFPRLGLTGADLAAWERIAPLLETLGRARERLPFLLHDQKASEEELVAFLEKYTLSDRARALKTIQFDREWGAYSFNYTVGREILRRYLSTGNARAKFVHLLTTPVFPSLMEKWIEEGYEP